ncbi:MAG TPA: hypothetical protein VKB80_06830 [Kofleriaceae bacterium]|nr:hypothetical protein [Kofleriaceae bacterium]
MMNDRADDDDDVDVDLVEDIDGAVDVRATVVGDVVPAPRTRRLRRLGRLPRGRDMSSTTMVALTSTAPSPFMTTSRSTSSSTLAAATRAETRSPEHRA